MTNPITIALGIPVSVDGSAITELSIRRPKVRDLEACLEAHYAGCRLVTVVKAGDASTKGGRIDAGEAERLGLINQVVPPADLMATVFALANEIAQKSPLILKLLKRTLADGDEMPLRAALRHEQAMIGLVLDSADAHEGCSAFVEKRKAQFKGR